jgi:hypothetical protein
VIFAIGATSTEKIQVQVYWKDRTADDYNSSAGSALRRQRGQLSSSAKA